MSDRQRTDPSASPRRANRRRRAVVALGMCTILTIPPSADAWSRPPKNEIPWYRNEGTPVLLIVDESQDSIDFSSVQLERLIYSLATYAAETEGSLAVAGLRNNSIAALQFTPPIAFSTKKHSDEQRKRDLTAQRNAVDLARLAQAIHTTRKGPEQTDLLEAMVQIQSTLAGLDPDGRPALVVVVTNGLVVTRDFNFRRPQPGVENLLARVKALGLLAHLPNVRLVLVGLGRAPSGVDARKYQWLQSFWHAYARAASAVPYPLRSINDVSLLVERAHP